MSCADRWNRPRDGNLIKPSLVLTSAYARESAQGATRTKEEQQQPKTTHSAAVLAANQFGSIIFLPFLSFMAFAFLPAAPSPLDK